MLKQKTKKKEDSQILHLTRVWIQQKFILLFFFSRVKKAINIFKYTI